MTPAEQIQQAWERAMKPGGNPREASNALLTAFVVNWPAVWQSLAEKDAALAAAVKERDALRAIVERLPKSRDGKVVMSGDYLYEITPDGGVNELIVKGRWEKCDTTSHPLPAYAAEGQCYSTVQLAEVAAKEARQ